MGIQCFLNFGDICHIYFRDMGYFFKIIEGIRDTGTPLPGPYKIFCHFFLDCRTSLICHSIQAIILTVKNCSDKGVRTFICAHEWIFFKLCINNSLNTNNENVFFELDS